MGMTIIKDYNMPHNCYDCELHNYHECDLTCESIEEDYCWNGDSREKHCPLREVEAIPKAEYEARLKAEREKIAEDVADKMGYMGSCLNERNIILGIITGKRETFDSLCSICKSESCISNGTAIPKADYEKRLKADMVAMLTEIQLEIEELNTPPAYQDEDYFLIGTNRCSELIQQKIDKLKG